MLPPYLAGLGYYEIPEIAECDRRGFALVNDQMISDGVWSKWRAILEYAGCAEFAREAIRSLPTGLALGSVDLPPARYHSASLVFFAQATLDNIALWTAEQFALAVTGSDIAFHKPRFIRAAIGVAPSLAPFFSRQNDFVQRLVMYRQEWIHRMAGGAEAYSEEPPPHESTALKIPMDPIVHHENPDFVALVAKLQAANGGRWLYEINEFADLMADGLKDFIVSFLAIALAHSGLPQGHPCR